MVGPPFAVVLAPRQPGLNVPLGGGAPGHHVTVAGPVRPFASNTRFPLGHWFASIVVIEKSIGLILKIITLSGGAAPVAAQPAKESLPLQPQVS